MKRVFITGVSSGLGYALADAYLSQGAKVYGCSRREPRELIAKGLRFEAIDLSGDAVAGGRALKRLLAGVDTLDLVILNAAKLGQIQDMQAVDLADLRETMEVNVFANKWMLDTIFECLDRVAQVVAISSGASLSGSRGWNGYSLSKAALNMLVKLYAGECSDTHFTSLAPGLVDTAMQDYLTSLPADDRYAPLQILKDAKGTEKMPTAHLCAERLISVFELLRNFPSGSYQDIRKL